MGGIKSMCCGASVQEVMVDCVVESTVISVDDTFADYDGVPFIVDGTVDRYQCSKCGQTVAETEEQLIKIYNGTRNSG